MERCYECRKLMYPNIMELVIFEDYEYFIEGTDLTYLLEERPLILVGDIHNMTHPVVECKITKDDVSEMIQLL